MIKRKKLKTHNLISMEI